MALLFSLVYGLNAQRPGHSLFIAGTQLPLEARVGGIFSGLLISLCYFVLLGRVRSVRYPRGAIAVALLSFVVLLSADGFNALLFDLGRPHLYPPSNPLRFATGLLCGLTLAAFALPSIASILWLEAEWEAPIETVGELAAGVVVLSVVWLLVVADLWYLLYPAAVLLVAGAVLPFTLANVYVLGLLRRWSARSWRDALTPLAISVGLALVELQALSLLRNALNWGARAI